MFDEKIQEKRRARERAIQKFFNVCWKPDFLQRDFLGNCYDVCYQEMPFFPSTYGKVDWTDFVRRLVREYPSTVELDNLEKGGVYEQFVLQDYHVMVDYATKLMSYPLSAVEEKILLTKAELSRLQDLQEQEIDQLKKTLSDGGVGEKISISPFTVKKLLLRHASSERKKLAIETAFFLYGRSEFNGMEEVKYGFILAVKEEISSLKSKIEHLEKKETTFNDILADVTSV